VHAGLVKATLGEANKGCIQDLTTPICSRICLKLGHKVGKMNERSFIVKSELKKHSPQKETHASGASKCLMQMALRTPCYAEEFGIRRSGTPTVNRYTL
jgi:hypothetical protein